MPKQAAEQLAPESLVARIIAELEANPAAQQMLLSAMLTNEFLGMPVRLHAIERDVAEIKGRVSTLERDVTEIKGDVAETKGRVGTLERDVAEMKIDLAALKGDSLEVRMHKWIRPFLSQKMGLRRPHIVYGAVGEADRELQEAVYEAVDAERITAGQEVRVFATDLILRAQRESGRTPVWVAVEASNTLDRRDIERAREAADALQAIFGEPSAAAVMGHAIRAEHRELAGASGVEVFIVDRNH